MLKVKPSKYNLVVDTQANGTVLLFNTFSTALCLLDVKKQGLLKEAQYDAGNLNDTDRKSIEQLTSMGFLVDQEIDERQRLGLRQNMARYGRKTLTLTIGPTLNCNLRCPYCFEAERHQTMTEETAEKLIDFLKSYIEEKKIETVGVTWYGGEPLLTLNRIEQISNELIPFCEGKSIAYSANIVTNGYCLDRGSAELLRSLKVDRAQITIDGLEETHNARRKLKNGGGSFWPIVKNIESVKDIMRIVVRVNVDKENMKEIDALTDFFMDDMKWGKNPAFYLAPVQKTTEDCGADLDMCLSADEFSSLYQAVMEKMFEHGITEIAQQVYPAYTDVGCTSICSNNFVIDANGYFYTCWNYFGDVSKSIGHLDEPNKIGLRGDYLHWMTVPMPEKCMDCVYLPLCQGGCPDKRIKNQNQADCGHQHLMYLEGLKLAFRAYGTKK